MGAVVSKARKEQSLVLPFPSLIDHASSHMILLLRASKKRYCLCISGALSFLQQISDKNIGEATLSYPALRSFLIWFRSVLQSMLNFIRTGQSINSWPLLMRLKLAFNS